MSKTELKANKTQIKDSK